MRKEVAQTTMLIRRPAMAASRDVGEGELLTAGDAASAEAKDARA